MRATKAYIASAGTAAVMLAASLSVFALLSAFIAFGSWPGAASHSDVDQIVLQSVQGSHAGKVTVSRNAVADARRDAARRAARTLAVTPTAGGRIPVTVAPTSPAVRTPVRQLAAAPAPTSGGGSKPVRNVTQNVTDTTQQVTQQVQQQVQNVQQQVDQVVDQVIGGGSPDSGGGAVQTVTNTAGSVLGK